MTSRTALAVAALFWAAMNVLLWRAEFGGGQSASEIPASLVWEKMLSSADRSVLNLRFNNRTIGSIEWVPSITETVRSNAASEIEGMVSSATGYNLRLTAKFFGGDTAFGRMLITGDVDFSTNRAWTDLTLRVDQRPQSWEVKAESGSDRISVVFEEGRRRFEQTFQTRDMTAIGAILSPYMALLPQGAMPDTKSLTPEFFAHNIQWSAHNDWLKIRKNRIRVYRLNAKFAGRFEGIAYISRAGEILKIQLPDGIQLVNDALAGM